MGALCIGIAAGIACYWGAAILKPKLGYDDSLDVFAVHGLGGIVGAILTSVFAVEAIGGTPGALEGNSRTNPSSNRRHCRYNHLERGRICRDPIRHR